MTQETRPLTREEQKAIDSLKRLARRWPRSLTLFSWSGSLVILDSEDKANGIVTTLDDVFGIPNDGGDPDEGPNRG